ncbi:hypothetical protein MJO28_003418, partial [Puccinia striiformis f. sp. tritici]
MIGFDSSLDDQIQLLVDGVSCSWYDSSTITIGTVCIAEIYGYNFHKPQLEDLSYPHHYLRCWSPVSERWYHCNIKSQSQSHWPNFPSCLEHKKDSDQENSKVKKPRKTRVRKDSEFDIDNIELYFHKPVYANGEKPLTPERDAKGQVT